ncbi:hypothetical protein D9M68_813450 [compost metagenome]
MLGEGFAVRQQAAAEQHQVDETDGAEGQGRRGDLEHAERLEAGLARHAVHQDVGGGADHGQHAAQHRGIGQRDQQFRRRAAGTFGQGDGYRGEDGYHRGVVEEGRHHQGRDHQACEHAGGAVAHQVTEPVAKGIDATCALQRCREYEHAGDGYGGGVGKHAEHVVGRELLSGQQGGDGDGHNHVRGPLFADERIEHPDQERRHE